MYQLLSSKWAGIFYLCFFMILSVIMIIYLNNVNRLIFVMVKCGVLFEVRTEYLNNI
jgi:lipopolysaccharide export LptBFGC system permease protein LptF